MLKSIYNTQILDNNLGDLRNFGYRIYVVNWGNSRQKIQNNADNLIKLIDSINCDGQIEVISKKL